MSCLSYRNLDASTAILSSRTLNGSLNSSLVRELLLSCTYEGLLLEEGRPKVCVWKLSVDLASDLLIVGGRLGGPVVWSPCPCSGRFPWLALRGKVLDCSIFQDLFCSWKIPLSMLCTLSRPPMNGVNRSWSKLSEEVEEFLLMAVPTPPLPPPPRIILSCSTLLEDRFVKLEAPCTYRSEYFDVGSRDDLSPSTFFFWMASYDLADTCAASLPPLPDSFKLSFLSPVVLVKVAPCLWACCW